MVNAVSCYLLILQKMMKLAGMKQVRVEIDTETSMTFWVPAATLPNNNNKPTPKKQALLLIHGFAANGILTWQFQALSSSLRSTYSLYIPDLLFFGGSHTSHGDRSSRFQAHCLAAGLRKLGVEGKCLVVGFSYGGWIGCQLAHHHPDLVQGLVLSCTVLTFVDSISHKILHNIGFSSWDQFLMPKDVKALKIMLRFSSRNFPWFPSLFYRHFLQVMFNNAKERFELIQAMVVKEEEVFHQQFINERVHLLWGNEDKLFTMEIANDLKEQLGAKAKLVSVKKAGHLVMLDRPFAFNKCLKELLSSLAAQ